MRKLLALVAVLAMCAPARAVECDQLTGGLGICLPRYGTDFDQWATSDINALTLINSSAAVTSTSAVTMADWLMVHRISGLATGTVGVQISSYTWFTSSAAVTGGGGLAVTYGVSAATGVFIGDVTAGSFTGNVTGSASLNVLKAGDIMTGQLTGTIVSMTGAITGALLAVPGSIITSTGATFNGGSVGIGTNAPGTKLHISSGTLTVDGTGAMIRSNGGAVNIYDSSGVTEQISLNADGKIYADRAGAGTAADPSVYISVNSDTGLGLYRAATNKLGFAVNGLAGGAWTIGGLGIGTISPAAGLEISTNTAGDWAAKITNASLTGRGVVVRGGLAASGHKSFEVGDKDGTAIMTVTPSSTTIIGNVGIGATPTQTLDVRGSIVSNSSITASAFYGNGANLTGITGAGAAVFASTYAVTATYADVTVGTVEGVCYASATKTMNGGVVTFSFSASARNASGSERTKAAVLMDGDWIEPYKSFGAGRRGMGESANAATGEVTFTVATLSAVSAASHNFCLTMWRETGSSGIMNCGTDTGSKPCVLHISEVK